jgi:hypothetical protein
MKLMFSFNGHFFQVSPICFGRDIVVGIATDCGRSISGIEFQWRRDFPNAAAPALVPTQSPVQCVPCLFPRVKRQGRGVDRSPPSSVKGKERVELYIYSRSGPSWPDLGRTFALPPICVCVYVTASCNSAHFIDSQLTWAKNQDYYSP